MQGPADPEHISPISFGTYSLFFKLALWKLRRLEHILIYVALYCRRWLEMSRQKYQRKRMLNTGV